MGDVTKGVVESYHFFLSQSIIEETGGTYSRFDSQQRLYICIFFKTCCFTSRFIKYPRIFIILLKYKFLIFILFPFLIYKIIFLTNFKFDSSSTTINLSEDHWILVSLNLEENKC